MEKVVNRFTNNLLSSTRVQNKIAEYYGEEHLKAIKDSVNDIIMGDIPAITAMEKILTHMRNGASIAAMGFSLTTTLVQPLGLTQSVVRIGAANVGKGISKYVAGGESMAKVVEQVPLKKVS